MDTSPPPSDSNGSRREGRLRRTVQRGLLRNAHLVERVFAGPLTPQVRTYSRTVFMWENATLKRYTCRAPRKYKTPVIIVPPLMANPVIFDLRPGHSMVHTLLDGGLDTFMLDFGAPTEKDRDITVEDYVTDFIPKAIERVREETGQPGVSLIGWSMGGIMTMLYGAIYGEKSHLKNAVILGSPFDYSKMFPLNLLAGAFAGPTAQIIQRFGNIPGEISRRGFMLVAPLGTVTRWWTLLKNYHDREYVAAWESMGDFLNGFLDYPQEAFLQFLTEFIRDDKLRHKKLFMGGKYVDLEDVLSSILLFVGTTDKIATPESVSALAGLVGSKDVTVKHVPVGHIGLVEGSRAPKHIWTPMTEWLQARS
ncbi:MAG: alpha/beta fold hydrolase [Bdellovibrionota bacterium]